MKNPQSLISSTKDPDLQRNFELEQEQAFRASLLANQRAQIHRIEKQTMKRAAFAPLEKHISKERIYEFLHNMSIESEEEVAD